MNSEHINSIFGITESYQLPDKLMSILFDRIKSKAIFEQFMSIGESLDHDWFTEYFEEEHSNKSKMAQDFTPKELCELLNVVSGRADVIADVCAGTGGLSISAWNQNKWASFICYELSERAIPLLLFNLAIRNIAAKICRTNLLTGEIFECYQTIKGEMFANVEMLDTWEDEQVDVVISNPPYSLKYNPKADDRFSNLKEMLPSNFADFVFVAFAMRLLNDTGKAVFILPHGVLFRSNKERLFRKMLIDNAIIKSVIGLPDKLFINTDIPTCIIELKKDGIQSGILFIDAKKECEKSGKKNIIRDDHLKKITSAYKMRANIDRFAYVATLNEIIENDYNLNIPRYVDTFIPEPLPDPIELLEDLATLEVEATRAKKKLVEMMKGVYGTTPEAERTLKQALGAYKREIMRQDANYRQEVFKFEIDDE